MGTPVEIAKIYTGVVLDFETGGLDASRCACTQIALQSVRFDTWQVIDRYVKYIYPYGKQELGQSKRKVLKTKHDLEQARAGELMDYQKAALEYSGVTMDTLYRSGLDLKEVAADVIRLGEGAALTRGAQCKPVLIGQNIPFDIAFLQQLMNYAGMLPQFEKTFAGHRDFYGNFQPHYIDTIDLARLTFAADPTVASYKLELIAERFGIELDDAHDADADVTATLNIAQLCSARLRNGEGADIRLTKPEKTRNHFKI